MPQAGRSDAVDLKHFLNFAAQLHYKGRTCWLHMAKNPSFE